MPTTPTYQVFPFSTKTTISIAGTPETEIVGVDKFPTLEKKMIDKTVYTDGMHTARASVRYEQQQFEITILHNATSYTAYKALVGSGAESAMVINLYSDDSAAITTLTYAKAVLGKYEILATGSDDKNVEAKVSGWINDLSST